MPLIVRLMQRFRKAAGDDAGRRKICSQPGNGGLVRRSRSGAVFRPARSRLPRSHRQRNRAGRTTCSSIDGTFAPASPWRPPPLIRTPPAAAQEAITLHGAVQFNDDHAFNRTLVKFEELVKKYYGKPINFVLHKNSELGLEKQYFEYMAQGKAVDYAIVSPAHMSTFSKAAPFIDAPFLFRDLDALEQGARRRPVQAGRRRDRQEGRRHADRLCRRRHAQHLRQQAGDATWPRSRASRCACRARRSGTGPSRRPAWRRP